MIVSQKGCAGFFTRSQKTSLGELCIVPDCVEDQYSQNTMHSAPVAYNQVLEPAQAAARAASIASTPVVVTRIVTVGVVIGESAPDEDQDCCRYDRG